MQQSLSNKQAPQLIVIIFPIHIVDPLSARTISSFNREREINQFLHNFPARTCSRFGEFSFWRNFFIKSRQQVTPSLIA
jgi:hypothetical protein